MRVSRPTSCLERALVSPRGQTSLLSKRGVGLGVELGVVVGVVVGVNERDFEYVTV
jgi:hypothetical protein